MRRSILLGPLLLLLFACGDDTTEPLVPEDPSPPASFETMLRDGEEDDCDPSVDWCDGEDEASDPTLDGGGGGSGGSYSVGSSIEVENSLADHEPDEDQKCKSHGWCLDPNATQLAAVDSALTLLDNPLDERCGELHERVQLVIDYQSIYVFHPKDENNNGIQELGEVFYGSSSAYLPTSDPAFHPGEIAVSKAFWGEDPDRGTIPDYKNLAITLGHEAGHILWPSLDERSLTDIARGCVELQ